MAERGMGDNSGKIEFDSEERRALFFSHLNPIWEIQKQLDDLSAKKRELKLQAKAEGFESFEIDFGLKIRKTEKPETITNRMIRLAAVQRFMNQPVGYQINFLSDDLTPAVDRAYAEGLNMGLEGQSLRNTYDQSVPQWKALNEGYEDGQRQLREAMQRRMEAGEAKRQEEAAARAAEFARKSESAADQSGGDNADAEQAPPADAAPKPKRGRPAGSGEKAAPAPGKTFSEQLRENNSKVDNKIKAAGQALAGAEPAVA